LFYNDLKPKSNSGAEMGACYNASGVVIVTQAQLQEAKKAAKEQFKRVDGVQGFGLGENTLNIYIRNPEVKRALPTEYHGVPITFVTTGDIQPYTPVK
jgi:hypothetical protein